MFGTYYVMLVTENVDSSTNKFCKKLINFIEIFYLYKGYTNE